MSFWVPSPIHSQLMRKPRELFRRKELVRLVSICLAIKDLDCPLNPITLIKGRDGLIGLSSLVRKGAHIPSMMKLKEYLRKRVSIVFQSIRLLTKL